MYSRIFIFILLLLFSAINGSLGQVTRDNFGKNRVQYKNFDWRFYSSDNFDIYFYEGGQENARIAAQYLEKEFDRITDMIGYAPYSKTKIFLYNSVKDLQQSNAGVHEKLFTVSGQTNFVKSQVEIAYPGNMLDFKKQLVLDISRMLINDMMFGGSLTDMFQSAYLLSLSDWFIEGAARYIAEGWSIEMDDFMRDLFHENQQVKLSRLNEEDAALAGQSVWNFIAIRYGRSSISNILNLTRIIRNEENSIVNTLGIPFRLFKRQWQTYYDEMAAQTSEDYFYPAEDQRIRKNNRKDFKYKDVAVSPDGRYVAYSENYKGKYKVRIRDIKRGKTKTIHTGGYKVINQEIDMDVPLLAWNSNQALGIIGYQHGQSYLWLYNLGSKKKRQIQLRRFNQVKDYAFNQNGRLLVMSGDINGQNDLFIFNPDRNSIKRLTNDIYDDLNPRFIPETNQIVFSSNRPDDSLYYAPKKPKEVELRQDINDNFNIFILDMDSEDSLLSRVSNTVSKDIKPIPLDQHNIYYLSDQQGVFNLYRYNLEDSIFNQVSNYALSIQDYDASFANNLLSYIMLSDKDDYVYVEENFDFNHNIFTPKTQRQQAMQARIVSERMAKNQNKNRQQQQPETLEDEGLNSRDSTAILQDTIPPDNLAEGSMEMETEPADTIPADTADAENDQIINTDDYQFDDEEPLEEGLIDTDNYVFNNQEEEVVSTEDYAFEKALPEENNSSNSFLARYRKLQKETRIEGPFPYQTRFSADNVVTSLIIDPIRNFGFHMEVQMNDMLEDHRFYGGLVQFTDLRSASIFGEYQYLKNRIDYHFRYEREGIFRESGDGNIQKYTMNRFQAGAAFPFNASTRLEVSPFAANTHYMDLSTFSTSPTADGESTYFYGGLKAGFVLDNTLVQGLNQYEGTRARAFLTHYQGVNDAQKSFTNVEIDIRHYQKIHRGLTLATRVFYGNFFGNNPQRYLLGGMNNWIFNKTSNAHEEDSPLAITRNKDNSDILFMEFVDMRGFNYNKFNGSDVLTFTAELRLPVIRYFYRGPIASNFFRNLEFIGFYDIGSSWTGNSPFSEQNSLNTEIRKSGPFRAEIQNFKNPWLQSYGAGVRTVLLGYYLKFDMAYPIEDNIVSDKPHFYLTLGYDF